MSVINELASSLGIRNEIPNQQLAARIAKANDSLAIKELVENLKNKKKEIQSDCIKTLYETAAIRPDLVSPYVSAFIELIDSKYPRLVWGAMTAISAVAALVPDEVYGALPKIMYIADHSGSVIARDHAMYILAALARDPDYYDDCYALIAEQLLKAPVNQFAMYAETTYPVIHEKDKEAYKAILVERLETLEQEPKRKRILKVFKIFLSSFFLNPSSLSAIMAFNFR